MKTINKFITDNKSAWADRLKISRVTLDKRLDQGNWRDVELDVIAEFYSCPKEILLLED